jgi:RHS repeat-associated protein
MSDTHIRGPIGLEVADSRSSGPDALAAGGLGSGKCWLMIVALLIVSTYGSAADDVFAYSFNGADQLVEVRMGTDVISSHQYDGAGLRAKKSSDTETIYYVRDEAGNVVAEYDASGALLAEYVYVSGQRTVRIDASGNRSHYHTDHLGTPLVITDDTGAQSSRAEYRPFGTEVDREGTRDRYSFTGQEHDEEIGLYYYKARYYDSRLGRFISVDPVGGSANNLQSWNRYSYVQNNPINAVDPNGEETIVVSGQPSVFHDNKLHFLVNGLSRAASIAAAEGEQRTWIIFNGGDENGFPAAELGEYRRRAAEQGINVLVVTDPDQITSYVNNKNGGDSRSADPITNFAYVGHSVPGQLDPGYPNQSLDLNAFDSQAFSGDSNANLVGGCNTAVGTPSAGQIMATKVGGTVRASSTTVVYQGGVMTDQQLLKQYNGRVVEYQGTGGRTE